MHEFDEQTDRLRITLVHTHPLPLFFQQLLPILSLPPSLVPSLPGCGGGKEASRVLERDREAGLRLSDFVQRYVVVCT